MKNSNYLRLTFFILVSMYINLVAVYSQETKIILKLNNDIITNIDIENEYDYLILLNQNLEDIDDKTLKKIAKNSLIKEIIKKNELIKYVDTNDERDSAVDQTIKEIYKKIGISSEEEFKEYLKKKDLDFKDIYQKIKVEVYWNQLIYSKYSDQLNIDEDEIKKKILNNNEKQEVFNLSEIVYEFNTKEEIENKYKEIENSVKDIGFEKTVLLFSVAPSKNDSGSIGWIRKSSLSDEIKKEIENLQINEITNPINIPSGILVLKLNKKRLEDEELDLKKELDKEINRELNNQLNNYSLIFFNKIKNNYIINEY